MRWALYILTLLTIGCVATEKADSEVLTPCYTPKYATSFSIATDSPDRKVIVVTNPYQSDKPTEQRLYLLSEGQNAPTGEQSLRLPAQRIACLSSSHIAMLDAIGCAERIVGVSGVKFVTNDSVKSRAVEIGYDSALDFERLKAVRTDLILLYGLYGEQSGLTTKLTQLGIPYIYIGDYIEPSPLGKAEWMVALAALCDMQSCGEECFAALESRYNTLKQSVVAVESRPKVMLNTPYRDTWFMPPVNSYMVQLITDAGGEYIYPQNRSRESQPISLEQALLLCNAADVWINVGQTQSLEALKRENPKFASAPAVISGRVYNNTKRTTTAGGSDFWESGAVNADIVLRDMINILHHNALTDSLYYYQQLQ